MSTRQILHACGARAGAGGPRERAHHPAHDTPSQRGASPTTGRRALHTWVAGLVLLVLGASLSAVSTAAAVTVPADQDAWLKQAAPNDNFGADKEVSSKTKPGDSERAVFHFNLGGLPPNANIQSAVATFRVTTPDSSPVQVYRITQAWTENGVTWANTGNAYDAATVQGTFTPSQDDSVVTVNLTTLVQQWVAGTAPNHGIMLISTSSDRQSKYHSKDMDVAAFRPVLEVTLVTPTALTPNPLTLTVGATGTLTATIAPAPSVAGNLTVSSANPGVATVPASVAFAANQTQIPIPVTAVAVGTAQLTVSLNGGTVMSTVDVNPPVLTVTSLTPASLSITQGGTGTLTVTINAVQSTHTVVNLTSSAASIAAVPATVTVPAGQTTAPVPVSANTVGQADLTASLHGTTATSHVTVTPALPTVVSLLPPATHVTLGASGTLTLTISAAQAANTSVTLAVTPANLVTLPSTVIVPANQTSATVSVTGAALGTALITASLNGTTATAAVDVLPPGVQLTALQPPTQKLVVDAIGTLTLQLHAQQTGPTVLTVSVDPPTRLQVPPTVTVPPNQPQAHFTVTALTAGTATLTATLGSVSQTATVVVVPPPPSVVSLLPSPLPLVPGATGTLTLTINAAQPTDTVVPLTHSAPSLIDVPPSVTVPAGRTTVGLPVAALAVGTATVTATLNGTALATVQVVPPPVTLTALGPVPPAPSPLTLAKGRIGVLRVTVTRVPLDPTIVSLSNSAASLVTVPPTVTVPAGTLFAEFPVTTQQEGPATITASLNSSSVTAEVVVTAPDIDAVTLAPLAPTVFATEPVPFTATATMTDGTTQPLTSNLTWTSTTTTVATIDNTGFATTLAAGTTTIKAATTNSLGPVTGETTLTVQPTPALTLTPLSGTLAAGQHLNLVVTSPAPAGPNGLTVNLVQAGTGTVTMVPTTMIPANGTTNSVVITGATFGQVTITASAVGRLPATATFTITPAPPTIAGFTPVTGPVGTSVTITGTNLNGSGPGSTTVKFNTTNAIITSVTATSLTTTVPQGATTGFITVVTPGGTAVSAQTFTVTTSQDFSLTVAPVGLSVVQGQPITTQVQLANTGSNPVTGFVALAATGLPTGMTGAFTPSQIAGGQTATLTLNSGTAPAGPVTITVTATTVVEGQTIVRQSPLTVTVLAAGGTTLAGRILATKDDAPIPGARVKIGTLIVTTDASGNFLFSNPPTGSQVLLIDGPSAVYPGDLPVQMTIQPGVANVLPYPVFLHEVSQNYIPIVPGAQTIVAPLDVPDFTMIIPAGTTITGWDGQPNVRVSITPVSVDRIPVPPPPANLQVKQTYMFNFGKPGGGYPSRPIPILLPNDLGAAPGERVDFWYFDESPTADPTSNQWKMYGQGTISADGKQAIPDPGVGQPKFCCGITFIGRQILAALGFIDPVNGGDPVLLQTGMFNLQQTDLVLPGRIPLVIRRAYRSQDPGNPSPPIPPTRELVNSNAFGFNTALLEYDDRMTIGGNGQSLIYTSGFSRETLSLQTDGTYRAGRTPNLAGRVGRVNQDGSTTLRDKNGTVHAFGADGWIRSITDRNGNQVTIVRSGNQIQQIIEPGGRALTFQYGSGGISQITDPIGRTVRYTYESSPPPFGQAQLRSVENPAGGTTTYTYDGRFNLLTITDARGITYLTNTYVTGTSNRPPDPAVATQTMADGALYRFDYVVTNRSVTQTTVTDGRGNKTVHRFNGRNHEVATVDALGLQTRMTRDFTTNQVPEVRDPLNRLTKYTFDLAGNVNSILDTQQNPTIFEYEPTFNRVTKITDALNQIRRFTYDPVTGNLLTTTDPLLHATTIAYNQFGQPISVTDALNHTTTFEYNEVGDLIVTTDPLGNRTLRFYDAVSRLIAIVDPRGKSAQFMYDALNRVTQIQDAINGITSFTYDPNGNLLTVTDAKNQVTTYTYDNMDRLDTKKDALNRTESYQYDLAGNLTTFTDRKSQVAQFQYDALNRRTNATYADSTTTFTYDTVGRLVKASDTAPNAGTIEFGYDILNRLIQETTGQGTVAYQYDVLGRRTQMVANGQQPTLYQYDAASRLTRVEQGALFAALGYDNASRRTSLGYSNGTTMSYGYDLASRLTNITHNGPSGIIESLTYTHDAAGNRFSTTRANGTASLLPSAVAFAAYNSANEQTQFAGATLTYDANGNLTNDGVNTYQWDARNRLIGISGGVPANFTYDALGRRTSKTINGLASQFAYDGNDIVAEIGGGAVGANYLRSLSIDEPFIRQSSTGNEHYHTDALGSSLALSNTQGSSSTAYTYEPFGKTTVAGNSANAFQYTGRENDGTALYYYRARYFSPARQRFISEDPIGFLGGDTNVYAYVRNAPLVKRDPLGLWDPDYHWKMTKDAAKACGMSDPEALANAVYNVDFSIWPLPSLSTLNPWSEKHGMPGTIWPEYASGQLNAAIPGGGRGALANALHARQDAYAHHMAGKGMYDHLPWLPDPDDPGSDLNKARAEGARRDTINTIRAYMLGRRKTPTCAEE